MLDITHPPARMRGIPLRRSPSQTPRRSSRTDVRGVSLDFRIEDLPNTTREELSSPGAGEEFHHNARKMTCATLSKIRERQADPEVARCPDSPQIMQPPSPLDRLHPLSLHGAPDLPLPSNQRTPGLSWQCLEFQLAKGPDRWGDSCLSVPSNSATGNSTPRAPVRRKRMRGDERRPGINSGTLQMKTEESGGRSTIPQERTSSRPAPRVLRCFAMPAQRKPSETHDTIRLSGASWRLSRFRGFQLPRPIAAQIIGHAI